MGINLMYCRRPKKQKHIVDFTINHTRYTAPVVTIGTQFQAVTVNLQSINIR